MICGAPCAWLGYLDWPPCRGKLPLSFVIQHDLPALRVLQLACGCNPSRHASQVDIAPPIFVISSNRPDDVPEHYQRYLLRGFRQAWGFEGVPIRLKFRARRKASR